MSERLNNLTAMILAGGLGTRLRPALADRQKVLAPVGGRPFIFFLLDQLVDAGLRHVVLCAGHKAEDVALAVGAEYRGVRVVCSREPNPLGTAGALRHALPMAKSDPVLALNGDSFCEADLNAFYDSHRVRGARASLVVQRVEETAQSGSVQFAPDGEVTRFAEKASSSEPGWINAGIYLLAREVLDSIPSGRAVSIERETFPAWIGRGLYAFPASGRFLDIGTPATYAKAEKVLP